MSRLIKWVGIALIALILFGTLISLAPLLVPLAIVGGAIYLWRTREPSYLSDEDEEEDEQIEYEHIRYTKSGQHYTTVRGHARKLPQKLPPIDDEPVTLLPEYSLSAEEERLVRQYRKEHANAVGSYE